MKLRYLLIATTMLMAAWPAHAADTQPSQVSKSGPGRWQIYSVTNGSTMEGKPSNRAENTILLDTETGRTWLFWPTKDAPADHSWVELPQRKDLKTLKPQ
jgi:hypothetical protein